MKTRLLYLDNMYQLTSQAHVIEIIQEDNSPKIILDQTVFYPQGGGQPCDKGIIKNSEGLFEVHAVSINEGIVYHKGVFVTGSFAVSSLVELQVDETLRALYNKNHTAGHIIDLALSNIGYSLVAGKAYHFPQGPYVEYQGTLDQESREALQVSLEKAANKLVEQALPVTITLLDNDPQKRAMVVNNHMPILCGGTHVSNTRDIGYITIRKIKNEKGNLRVSYAVI
jgi:Ser-tRNA(Ala) deacylase AlaX